MSKELKENYDAQNEKGKSEIISQSLSEEFDIYRSYEYGYSEYADFGEDDDDWFNPKKKDDNKE